MQRDSKVSTIHLKNHAMVDLPVCSDCHLPGVQPGKVSAATDADDYAFTVNKRCGLDGFLIFFRKQITTLLAANKQTGVPAPGCHGP